MANFQFFHIKKCLQKGECSCSKKGYSLHHLLRTGAHHLEPATTPCYCHGVFTNRSIFNFNLSRIQIPTGTLVTNCNHKHGIMSTCQHVHMRPHCFIFTEACSRRLEPLAYFAGTIPENRLVCKKAVALLVYYRSCRLLGVGSCLGLTHVNGKMSYLFFQIFMAVFILKTHYPSRRTRPSICSSSGYAPLV